MSTRPCSPNFTTQCYERFACGGASAYMTLWLAFYSINTYHGQFKNAVTVIASVIL